MKLLQYFSLFFQGIVSASVFNVKHWTHQFFYFFHILYNFHITMFVINVENWASQSFQFIHIFEHFRIVVSCIIHQINWPHHAYKNKILKINSLKVSTKYIGLLLQIQYFFLHTLNCFNFL